MNDTQSTSNKGTLTVAHTLAQLLERLDRSAYSVGAAQYRSVVVHLQHELEALQGDPRLGALLEAYPAAAELYENTVYAQAGLCRSPLEFSLQAELKAREAIQHAKHGTQPRFTNGQS
jgi:hypothetical protein